jgi:putative ABC transport system permease protein
MNLFLTVAQALVNLRANKLRSVLTMLGLVIGVSSVILLVSLVDGARVSVVKEFERLGSNQIQVGYAPSEKEKRKAARTIEGLNMEDVRAIRTECDLVLRVSPMVGAGGAERVRYGGQEVDNVKTTASGRATRL